MKILFTSHFAIFRFMIKIPKTVIHSIELFSFNQKILVKNYKLTK